MGTGDWNDGMNRVGSQGTGESIWLGWFLYKVLADFMPHCEQPTQEKYKAHMAKLKEALESEGWDGAWYRRAYFDDGTPLGSTLSEECKMDSIAQSWAVISGAGDPVRAQLAMKSVSDFLIRRDSQLILLLTPPFEKTAKNPGYIQGYVPGVRENGGQYTHAATWVMMAFAELGDGNQAMEVFNMLNPIRHSLTPEASSKYKTEPYALAGDVYAGQTYEGRGGWSWYTGSASWYYRVGLENLLGFRQKKDILTLSPCIPTEWKEFEINYNYGKSKYLIKVLNPHALCKGNVQIEMDGHLFDRPEIPLIDDGRTRKLTATLLKPKQLEYRADQTDSDPLKH
jgi:cellobiose phosphorylase